VINTRSFGEDPQRVARWRPHTHGLREGGAFARSSTSRATVIPTSTAISACRDHASARAARGDRARAFAPASQPGDAIMTAHIELPAFDDTRHAGNAQPKT